VGNRAEIMSAWLRDNAPDWACAQANLEKASQWPNHWTRGYAAALGTVLDQLRGWCATFGLLKALQRRRWDGHPTR
jgi:hypothetical protein